MLKAKVVRRIVEGFCFAKIKIKGRLKYNMRHDEGKLSKC